ncbi:hypothetical protein ACH5RR_006727 [Cinchona calisaya]|uniref:Uncharacterized protein n=1 Tax=Cinchona calisaya TaxID=153742 RepID=A0ABD3APT7_9GENT
MGVNPCIPIDLLPLLSSARLSVEAETFSKNILDIHDEVQCRIAINNEKYKSHSNLKRKFVEFQEGDEVMVHIHPERNIFNIEDFTSYAEHQIDLGKKVITVSLPPTTRLCEKAYDVLDHQLVSTRGGGYQKYLIHWKGVHVLIIHGLLMQNLGS